MKRCTRRSRPTTSKLVVADLLKGWKPLAEKRDCGFSWTGNTYTGKANKGDEKTLALHYDGLHKLLELAPTGFPDHGGLVDALLQLDADHGILATDPRFVNRAAALAAETWRLMCKHIYNWHYESKQCTDKKITDLMNLITTASDGVGEPDKAAGEPDEELDAATVQALFPSTEIEIDAAQQIAVDVDGSDDDLIFCGAVCQCEQCVPKKAAHPAASTSASPVAVRDIPSRSPPHPQSQSTSAVHDIPSRSPPRPRGSTATSPVAVRDILSRSPNADALDSFDAIPSAAIGGQKRSMMSAVRLRRLRSKTAMPTKQGKEVAESKKGAGSNANKKRKKTKKTKRADKPTQDTTIILPVVFKVKSATDEAYLEHNVRSKSRIAGITVARHHDHHALMKELQTLCNDGSIKTLTAARTWLSKRIVHIQGKPHPSIPNPATDTD